MQGVKKERDSSSSGALRASGGGSRVIQTRSAEMTRGLKLDCQNIAIDPWVGAAAGVQKDPGSLGGACPERSRTGSG